jgi:hypothetical protein
MSLYLLNGVRLASLTQVRTVQVALRQKGFEQNGNFFEVWIRHHIVTNKAATRQSQVCFLLLVKRGRHEVLFLKCITAKLLETKLEVCEVVKAEIGGRQILGGKRAWKLV